MNVVTTTREPFITSQSLPINFESLLVASLKAAVNISESSTLEDITLDGTSSSSPKEDSCNCSQTTFSLTREDLEDFNDWGEITISNLNLFMSKVYLDLLNPTNCGLPTSPSDEGVVLNSSLSTALSTQCSTQSSVSSPPTSCQMITLQSCSKKRVHFADSHGRPLVRFYSISK